MDRALVVRGNYQEASGERAAEDLLRRGIEFSALFAANDQMATGAAQALYRHGLRIPEDVSVVGFDDVLAAARPAPCWICWPSAGPRPWRPSPSWW